MLKRSPRSLAAINGVLVLLRELGEKREERGKGREGKRKGRGGKRMKGGERGKGCGLLTLSPGSASVGSLRAFQ